MSRAKNNARPEKRATNRGVLDALRDVRLRATHLDAAKQAIVALESEVLWKRQALGSVQRLLGALTSH